MAQEVWPGVQTTYTVVTDGSRINSKLLEKIGLNISELQYDETLPGYPQMPLTASMLDAVKSCANVASIEEQVDVYPPDYPDSYLMLFPYTEKFRWTRDNYGPIWIPEAGRTVNLNSDNMPLYERLIRVYEKNDLKVSDGKIYINGVETDEYTFKQDYYFMMGDNRHNSLDSRYWGFVPEDHIVGRPALIWLSTDANRKFPFNIRWNRFLKLV